MSIYYTRCSIGVLDLMIRELLVDLMMGKLVDIECIINSSNMHLCVCILQQLVFTFIIIYNISHISYNN